MIRILLCSMLAFSLWGCGGGSIAPTPTPTLPVVGLEIPTNLSLLTVQDTDPTAGTLPDASKFTSALSVKFDDPGTDFSNDESEQYVYEDSMESLNLVNEIVCLMSLTQASALVNEGPYIALMDEARCGKGENQSSVGETGQSSGGNAMEFTRWVIESTRADNDSPQIVRLWVPDPGDGEEEPWGPQTILVEVTVTEGVSDTSPFGSFDMSFRGVIDGAFFGLPAGTEVDFMKGRLQTVDNAESKPQFRFINLGGDALGLPSPVGFGFEQAANVILDDAEGTSGVALTHGANSYSFETPGGTVQGSEERSYAIAYNQTHFLSARDDNGDQTPEEQVCRSRDQFDVRVWRYNLYHENDGEFRGTQVIEGERVGINSGFPFVFDANQDGNADTYGWIGYHGLWTENDTPPADGSTIFEFDYASDTQRERTLRVSPGKLIRRSANEALLLEFVGDDFQYWGEHPTLAISGQWLVTVNGNGEFVVTGAIEWGDNGPEISTTVDHDSDPQTVAVDVTATIVLSDNDHLWLWSDALGGNVVYVHDGSLAAAARTVTFYAEEILGADDALFTNNPGGITLYCYDGCLKGGLTAADVSAASNSSDLFYQYQGTPITYTLDAQAGRIVLSDDSNGGAPVSTVDFDLSDLGFDWGINTGEMVLSPLTDPLSPWMVFDEPVSYRWETGPNDWNVLVSVTDTSGNLISFERPLQFSYTHTAANDANGDSSYDGKRFLLNYSGVGDLHGFPWIREGDSDRWHAAVNLADGVRLSSSSNNFVVKAMESEQSMREVAMSECSALDVNGLYSDQNLTLPTISDIADVTFTSADRPEVVDPPAVVDGELRN